MNSKPWYIFRPCLSDLLQACNNRSTAKTPYNTSPIISPARKKEEKTKKIVRRFVKW
jgi:hypothetical protein